MMMCVLKEEYRYRAIIACNHRNFFSFEYFLQKLKKNNRKEDRKECVFSERVFIIIIIKRYQLMKCINIFFFYFFFLKF